MSRTYKLTSELSQAEMDLIAARVGIRFDAPEATEESEAFDDCYERERERLERKAEQMEDR